MKDRSEYQKRYQKENKERLIRYRIKYNRDHKKERKEHREKNRQIIIEYDRIYYKKNKKAMNKRRRELYKENHEKKLAYTRRYKKEHPEQTLRNLKSYLERLGKPLNLNSTEYNYALMQWSKTIKKLDNNMCKLCDSKEMLNAHHIQSKKEFPKIALDLDNGITLCKDCHSKTHGYEIY